MFIDIYVLGLNEIMKLLLKPNHMYLISTIYQSTLSGFFFKYEFLQKPCLS